MSKQPYQQKEYNIEDSLQHMLDGISRLLLWGGIAGTILSLAFLVYTYIVFSGQIPQGLEDALRNIGIFHKILIAGVLALGVSTTFMFWGEETLGILQLGLAAALYFSPLYIPSMFGGATSNQATQAALSAIQWGGQALGALAILVLAADIMVRVKNRTTQGSKADQLKYGKGVKEERDIRNVLMGKCWQLPFCRKFVRERCPIYHARRTCWRERVGCMCEEEVIRGAMENKAIPKESLLASKFIPYNTKLTEGQKAERCRQCVIYNEHQKHKYKLALPLTIAGFLAVYFLFRPQLLLAMGTLIRNLEGGMRKLTYDKQKALTMQTGVFEEILLFAFMIVVFAYLMKLLEFLIFKLKV